MSFLYRLSKATMINHGFQFSYLSLVLFIQGLELLLFLFKLSILRDLLLHLLLELIHH